MPLVCAERAWAMAMELKSQLEVGADAPKRRRLLRRLAKVSCCVVTASQPPCLRNNPSLVPHQVLNCRDGLVSAYASNLSDWLTRCLCKQLIARASVCRQRHGQRSWHHCAASEATPAQDSRQRRMWRGCPACSRWSAHEIGRLRSHPCSARSACPGAGHCQSILDHHVPQCYKPV